MYMYMYICLYMFWESKAASDILECNLVPPPWIWAPSWLPVSGSGAIKPSYPKNWEPSSKPTWLQVGALRNILVPIGRYSL